MIEPVLNNTLSPPLMYDTLYRGLISSSIFKTGSIYTEFGNGMYNDHHYHYGYFVTASAMLKHLDPNWSRMPELERVIWTMLRDVVNPSADDTYFPRFRHFSWYLGHSYSHGVTSIDNGKGEESTSEDINFYYGMTLWGWKFSLSTHLSLIGCPEHKYTKEERNEKNECHPMQVASCNTVRKSRNTQRKQRLRTFTRLTIERSSQVEVKIF
ncbi:Endo-1 [Phytophthora citrophthora]|uniref:glucan endo-1,3-beta-D-glucosidase n=1 Tax=Phytophthora citrophthora TaxID=4793 RepID=A0AAD9LTI4_9STRA|nr:Endo-1 [Phytophthora citrophthora]